MIKRPLILVGIACAALLASSTGTPVAAQKNGNVQIKNGKVNPKRLPASGGTVNVTVNLNPRGAVISNVTARAEVVGSSSVGAPSTLSGDGRRFAGQVVVPSNSSAKRSQVNIVVTVTTAQRTVSTRVGRVVLQPGDGSDPNSPPAPPPI